MGHYTAYVLDRVDANFASFSSEPAPTLYDGDDGAIRGDAREREVDLGRDAPVVSVDESPQVQRETIGTEFDYRVEPGVSVRVEGLHDDYRGGTFGGAADFASYVQAVIDAINADREFPAPSGVPDTDVLSARIENEVDNSADRPGGYYERVFDVRFEGYRTLP